MMVLNILIKNVIAPVGVRIGSAIAGAAVTLGATVEQGAHIELGIVAAVAVGCDLLMSWLRRRSIANKAVTDFIQRNG